MDLEQLKQIWKENDSFQTEVNNSVIKEMLANRNKGAFERIKKYEKQALTIIPICAVSFVLCSMSVLLHGSMFGRFWVLMFIPIAAALWYWSFFLCRFLDKIDMGNMSVTEISRYIIRYKTYLVRHTIAATILMPIYMGIWLYNFVASANHEFQEVFSIEFAIGYLLILVVLVIVILWFRFFKHIRGIQRNLKELEQFELE
ncbi:hypothetical protein D0T50_13480 [Bacteroides sp. 214]|uniref:hypothetical protein n=1 Tax=Bacteroides sp. 214 TaxID=2302935 RepID=UPI0013D44836|nr:hypothetical protein [Bacteroides sp. 214]NDW13887.1 hypothetical protein [Bacteroides sp. 214]